MERSCLWVMAVGGISSWVGVLVAFGGFEASEAS